MAEPKEYLMPENRGERFDSGHLPPEFRDKPKVEKTEAEKERDRLAQFADENIKRSLEIRSLDNELHERESKFSHLVDDLIDRGVLKPNTSYVTAFGILSVLRDNRSGPYQIILLPLASPEDDAKAMEPIPF